MSSPLIFQDQYFPLLPWPSMSLIPSLQRGKATSFTFTGVTVLRQLETGSTAPAGVRSWAVQAQLARAQISHQALIHIWAQIKPAHDSTNNNLWFQINKDCQL